MLYKKKLTYLLMSIVFIFQLLSFNNNMVFAAGRTIFITDDLSDMSKIYKVSSTSSPQGGAILKIAPDSEKANYGGDTSLLQRENSGAGINTWLYYKTDGAIKSVSVEYYYKAGFWTSFSFYYSSDDVNYTWAGNNIYNNGTVGYTDAKVRALSTPMANNWYKVTFSTLTGGIPVTARYIKFNIVQNNTGAAPAEPLIGKVTIEYEAPAGYKSSDANLKTLKVGGADVLNFDPSVLSYDVKLGYDAQIGSTTEVTAEANDQPYASVQITQASAIPGAALVMVTAEDGVTQKTYTVNISKNPHIPGQATYYVSEQGSDQTGDGTIDKPWKSIQKAADLMVAGDKCIIRGGIYRENVVVKNSGTEQNPIIFEAYPGENAVISAAEKITGWQQFSGAIYKAPMSFNLGDRNQIFSGNTSMTEARWPNNTSEDPMLDPTWAHLDSGNATGLKDSDLTQPDGFWNGAKVFMVPGWRWTGSTTTVTGYTQAEGLVYNKLNSEADYALPRNGDPYYLYGKLEALDAEKEWYYDAAGAAVYLWAPGGVNPDTLDIEARARDYTFDLSGKSYININKISMFAGGPKTDNANNLVINNARIEHISYPINLNGNGNKLTNSTVAFSPGKLIDVSGIYNHIVNNYIHHAKYVGDYGGIVNIGGSYNLLSRNTLKESGRDVLGLWGGRSNIIEYNDMSESGKVAEDQGIIYVGFMDADNTEIRYNWVHGNLAHEGQGIYTDQCSNNYIIHHNVVWDMQKRAQAFNTPKGFMLYYNNTFVSNVGYYGTVYKEDMYGDRFFNNIVTGRFQRSSLMVSGHNLEGAVDPVFVDPQNTDFHLSPDSPAIDKGMVISGITDGYAGIAPDIGAYEFGGVNWTAGCDLDNPPTAAFQPVTTPYMNRIKNGGFERLAQIGLPWQKTGAQLALPVWEYNSQSIDKKTRNGTYAVQFGKKPLTNYQDADIAALQSSINAAQTVADNSGASPAEISSAVKALNNAENIFVKSAPTIINDPGFESGDIAQYIAASTKMAVTNTDSFEGTHSLRSYERSAFWSGPRAKILVDNGRTYNISVRVKLGNGNDNASIILLPVTDKPYEPTYINRGATSVNNADWTLLKTRYTFNEAKQIAYSYAAVQTSTTTEDLYIDMFNIVDVTELLIKLTKAQQMAATAPADVKSGLEAAIAQAQAVLDSMESTREQVSDAEKLLADAMADERIIQKQGLLDRIDDLNGLAFGARSPQDGMEQLITGLEPNTEYHLSVWSRVMNTSDRVQFGVRDFGGTEVTKTVSNMMWLQDDLYFTTGPDTTSATVFVSKPIGNDYVYMDDFGLVKADAAIPGQVKEGRVVNPGFESGVSEPWMGINSDVATVTEAVYNGSYALKTFGRKTAEAGAVQFIQILDGRTYDFQVMAKLERGSDNASIVVLTKAGEQIRQNIVATGQINDSGWTELKGRYTFSEGAEILSAALCVRTDASLENIYIDDFKAGEYLLPTPSGTGDAQTNLNKAIADIGRWVFSNGAQAYTAGDGFITLKAGNARYTGETYKDATLEFNLNLTGDATSWPIIALRNQGKDYYNSGYVIVLKQSVIELQKYDGISAIMIYIGDQYSPGIAGSAIQNSYYTYGQSAKIKVGTYNTDDGVEIVLYIDDQKVFDYEDTTNSIRTAGYFSLYSGGAQITLKVVAVPVDSVVLSCKEIVFNARTDNTCQLTAKVSPDTATNKNVTWTSSNLDIVTVDQTGKVMAVSDGLAIITVTTEDGGFKDTASVIVDVLPPVTTDDASEEWRNKAQTVKLTVTDAVSGVAGTYYKIDNGDWKEGAVLTVDEEGIHSIQYYSVDRVGNIEPVKTAEVKIDMTKPEILTTVVSSVYRTDTAAMPVTIADGLSGVVSSTIKLDGTLVEAVDLQPYSLSIGDHVIEVYAKDEAGNEALQAYTFKVVMDINHLDESVNLGYSKGWITNKGILDSLLAKINLLQQSGNNTINGLNALENEILAQSGKKIDQTFTSNLLADIAYLKQIN